MQFKDVAIGAWFKFSWSGYVCQKRSARTYDYNGHRHEVGTVRVEVEPAPAPVEEEEGMSK